MTRFIVETVEITDCDTDESRIAKVITDTNELYSYDDLYELCDDLNKLAEENEQLRKELGDCEKFRYTVFKRLNDEYIKECSIR